MYIYACVCLYSPSPFSELTKHVRRVQTPYPWVKEQHQQHNHSRHQNPKKLASSCVMPVKKASRRRRTVKRAYSYRWYVKQANR